jgi:hypothetical protein
MTTTKMITYVLVAGSRRTLRPHLPSAAQIRRGAYPRAVALAATHPASRARTMILLLWLMCGLGATVVIDARVNWGAHPGAAPAHVITLR